MRGFFLLAGILLLGWMALPGRAMDLMGQPPAGDSVYTHLRVLAKAGFLGEAPAETRRALLDGAPLQLTRFDIVLLLTDPLERCLALVATQETSTLTPEQQRRRQLMLPVVAELNGEQFDGALDALLAVTRSVRDELQELSPDLVPRVDQHLKKLFLPTYRPWLKSTVDWKITVNPSATPDPLRDPLAAPRMMGAPSPLPLVTGGTPPPSAVTARPATAFETAIDVAFQQFHLYGALSSLPGQDFPTLDSGRAKVGLEVGLGRINNLGLTGIFELHMMRYGAPGNATVNTSAVSGIGITW